MGKNDNYFEYKGYHTRIEFDYDSLSLCGKIEGISDLVVFECEDSTKIEQEFHNAVDNYLALCDELGKSPEKEYKGVFNVRVNPEVHRALSNIAYRMDTTLNAIVEIALESFVDNASARISNLYYGVSSAKEYSFENFSSNTSYYVSEKETC